MTDTEQANKPDVIVPQVISLAASRPKVPPNADAIQQVAGALQRLYTGETVGIALVEITPADAVTYSTAGVKNRWVAIGALSYLMHRLHTDHNPDA